MQQTPRRPVAERPEEPGWWLAVDGRWYPPELAQPASGVATSGYRGPVSRHTATGGDGTAIASLVIGILALLNPFWLMLRIGLIGAMLCSMALGGTAIALGVSARRSGGNSGLALAGMTIGAIALALQLYYLLTFLSFASALR
jgi:hypothetical protein